MSKHQPVLLKEVVEFLDPKPGENFIDATFGGGGHALEILKRTAPDGKVLGIDWDREVVSKFIPKAIEGFDGPGLDTRSVFKYASEPQKVPAETPEQDRSGVEPPSIPLRQDSVGQVRLFLFSGNFADIGEIARRTNFENADGVLFDLGFRTFHIEDSGRGFSFQKNEPLDMRYHLPQINADQTRIDADSSITAEKIVNDWPEKDLEKIFREYGEERNSKRITRAIVGCRQVKRIKTTGELAEIIDRTNMINKSYGSYRVKTLARVFQALRIAVNDELENIKSGLEGAWSAIGGGGRIAVISFHSLEDRVAKNFFAEKKRVGAGEILTKKPVTASREEITKNRKARSAKLRVIKKLENRI